MTTVPRVPENIDPAEDLAQMVVNIDPNVYTQFNQRSPVTTNVELTSNGSHERIIFDELLEQAGEIPKGITVLLGARRMGRTSMSAFAAESYEGENRILVPFDDEDINWKRYLENAFSDKVSDSEYERWINSSSRCIVVDEYHVRSSEEVSELAEVFLLNASTDRIILTPGMVNTESINSLIGIVGSHEKWGIANVSSIRPINESVMRSYVSETTGLPIDDALVSLVVEISSGVPSLANLMLDRLYSTGDIEFRDRLFLSLRDFADGGSYETYTQDWAKNRAVFEGTEYEDLFPVPNYSIDDIKRCAGLIKGIT